MSTVVLCEKREQGERVATGLGLRPGKGHYGGQWKGRDLVLVWASGHLLAPREPSDVAPGVQWNDPRTLVPLPALAEGDWLVPTDRGKKLLPDLKKALKGAGEVWLATDPDREGEAIGREILAHAGYRGTVKRLWLADSLEPADIQRAAERVMDGGRHRPLWRAQQARAQADWLWQFLVRAYTAQARRGLMGETLAQGRGKAGVVSVGRVQSATLAMVVERDRAIARFRPTDHYQVSITLAGASFPYAPTRPVPAVPGVQLEDDGRPLFLDGAAMSGFRDRVESAGKAHLAEAERGRERRQPPLPHSLTTLQRTLSRQHGLRATETLQTADKLRLGGWLTYPRTEHGHLPLSLYNAADLRSMLDACAGLESLAAPARAMRAAHADNPEAEPPRCFTDKPMEHHGIVPTGKAPEPGNWSERERIVFEECARALITALHPPAVFDALTVVAEVDAPDPLERTPARFAGRVQRLREPGWMSLEGREPESALPELEPGTEAAIEAAERSAHRTSPPKPFTEDTLLGAMRNAGRNADGEDADALNRVAGIGTPATRNAVIETLLTRAYIQRQGKGKSQSLRATDRGAAVIDHIPADLADVRITARWERALDGIAGEADEATAQQQRDAFVADQREFITRHIEEVITAMENAPESEIATTNPPTGKMLSAARKIAEARGLELPEGIEERFDVCKRFLDEKLDEPAPPTPKMEAAARRIAEEDGIELGDALDSFDNCKAFLDKHLEGRKKRSAPTDKMLRAAEAAARRHDIELPEEARTSFDDCKAFLDNHPPK